MLYSVIKDKRPRTVTGHEHIRIILAPVAKALQGNSYISDRNYCNIEPDSVEVVRLTFATSTFYNKFANGPHSAPTADGMMPRLGLT